MSQTDECSTGQIGDEEGDLRGAERGAQLVRDRVDGGDWG